MKEQITYQESVRAGGIVKILVNGKELRTTINTDAIKQFRTNRAKFGPRMEEELVKNFVRAINNEAIQLSIQGVIDIRKKFLTYLNA